MGRVKFSKKRQVEAKKTKWKKSSPPGIKPCSPAPEADTLTTILPQQMYFMLIHRGPTTVIPSKADFFSGSEWHPFFKKSLWAGTPKQNNKMFWIVSSRPSKGGDDDDDDNRSKCQMSSTGAD